MRTNSNFEPKLALCGIVSGLFLLGSAARYSVAQDPAKDTPALVPGSITTVKGDEPKREIPQGKAETKSETTTSLPGPGPAESLAVPRLKANPDSVPLDGNIATGAPAPVTIAPGHAAPSLDDPEKVATAFFEQNQKIAETHLKALKEEAVQLRARLTKVEVGIKRWDRVIAALKQSQGTAESSRPDGLAPSATKVDLP